MDPNRPPLPDLTSLPHDPVRLHDDATDEALRRDLTASRDAVALGIDHATVEALLLALVERDRAHDACG